MGDQFLEKAELPIECFKAKESSIIVFCQVVWNDKEIIPLPQSLLFTTWGIQLYFFDERPIKSWLMPQSIAIAFSL